MKNSKIKKLLLLVIVLTVILSSFSIAFASNKTMGLDGGPVTPFWIGINYITSDFDILSGGLANPAIFGKTYQDAVDYVNVKVYLKRGSGSSWTTIKSWDQDIPISLNSFIFGETYSVQKNYNYKYTATIKSYKDDSLLDTVSFESNIIAY